jgi:hypothetical protein
MATTVKKTLLIDENNAKTYCTATNLELQQSSYAFYLYLDGKSDGWAHLNDAGKEALYPTATAHPYQIDSLMSHSKSAGKADVILEFDDVAVHTTEISGISQSVHSQTGITNDIITNSTRATKIGWHIDASSTVSAFRVGHVEVSFYFNQYEFNGYKAKRAKGVDSITVSSNSPYEGDPTTFSVTLVEGAKWYGWYSDEAHTQLVSTDMNYTVIAGEDLTLYAYASLGTGLYIKKDGNWINSIDIYKKDGDAWVLIEKEEVDLEKLYFQKEKIQN